MIPVRLRPALALATLAACISHAPAHDTATKAAATPALPASRTIPRLKALDFAPFTAALASPAADRAEELHPLLREATLTEVQAALAAGRFTSEELTVYYLKRIQRDDETLRSYLELNPRCLDEARASDQRRKSGKSSGPLEGIPLNLKDNIGTAAPMHTTAGAEILQTHSPARDATVTRRLRDAGAVILGKASLSELAGSLTTDPPGYNAISGIGVNAYRQGLSVAGSSSGSAISTNAGLTFLSVGTETLGSLIAPGACNGVVAMKPSLGVVSGEGIVPLIRFQDSAGPIARHVADAAILLEVMDETDTDYQTGLKPSALEGVATGVLRASLTGQPPTEKNREWLRRIDDGLCKAKAAARDVPDTFRGKPEILTLIFLGLQVDTLGYIAATGSPVKTIADLKTYNEAQAATRIPRGQNMIDLAAGLQPLLLEQLEATPETLPGLYEIQAMERREKMAGLLEQAFRTAGVEVLVSLANQHSDLYATAHFPAITVPLGLDETGTPNGVTFIGKPGRDAALLAYAYAFEQATQYRIPPPTDAP